MREGGPFFMNDFFRELLFEGLDRELLIENILRAFD